MHINTYTYILLVGTPWLSAVYRTLPTVFDSILNEASRAQGNARLELLLADVQRLLQE